MSKVLLNKRISLNRRLKILDTTVGSCVMWCAESWTPRAEEVRQLKLAQNKMLRRVVGTSRAPDEPWGDWVQQATRKARTIACRQGVADWEQVYKKRKWLWAGEVARMATTCWVYRVTFWRDAGWQEIVDEMSTRPMRPSRRRWMKWEDSLRRHCSAMGLGNWWQVAGSVLEWATYADDFSTQ